jgi:RTX calcium-binding nonapeptide repeat (4 copies)
MPTTTYTVTNVTPSTRVNLTAAGSQSGEQTVTLANGSSVVFYGSGNLLVARTISGTGTPTGSEIFVSTVFSGGFDNTISVTQLTNGNIVVVWASNEATPNIYFQLYTSGMVPIGTNTLAETTGQPSTHPDVAAIAGGGFVITWEKTFSATDHDIAFRRFDSAGASTDLANGIALDATGAFDEHPSVAVLASGNIVIAFDRLNTVNGNTEMWQAVRNPDGTSNIAAVLFDSASTQNTRADVIARSDGGYSIMYQDDGWGTGQDITAANFSNAGAFQSYQQIGQGVGAQYNPDSARSGDGFIFVAYQELIGGNSQASGSLLAADGTLLANNLLLNGPYGYGGEVTWVNASRIRVTSAVLVPNPGNDGDSNGVAVTDLTVTRVTVGDATDETITFTGDSLNDNVDGGAGNDTINTGVGFNTVQGGLGDDTIRSGGDGVYNGGDGDDLIYAGNTTISETLDGGAGLNDTLDVTHWGGVYTINLVTGATNYGESFVNFENVQAGTGDTTIIGTSTSNNLSGSSGNDYLIGGGGNDFLFGGFGSNQLQGGTESDGYFVYTQLDSVIEFLNEGNDYVAPVGLTYYTIPTNVEILYAVNAAAGAFLGVGNALDNQMFGRNGVSDDLYGRDGNDYLQGGTGGPGQYNTLIGGLGDDTYSVDAIGDSTIELFGQGNDTVVTAFGAYGLQANIENLTANDSAAHAALVGNLVDNVIRGGAGVDSIFAREGNDTIRGGSGAANTLLGQEGDDLYIIEAVGDSVIEFAGQGNDTVQTALASITMRDNVENLIYTGGGNFTGIGSSTDNTITGGIGADFLQGQGGNDILIGGSGADELFGGTGGDKFRYTGTETGGIDRIYDFTSGQDRISLSTAFSLNGVLSFEANAGLGATTANSTFVYNTSNGIVSYDFDGNGAGAAVNLAQLNLGLTLVLADFERTSSPSPVRPDFAPAPMFDGAQELGLIDYHPNAEMLSHFNYMIA